MGMMRNAFALAKGLVDDKICHISDHGAPVDGVTGMGICGRGSFYFDMDSGVVYINSGTDKLQNWGVFGGLTSPQANPMVNVTAAAVNAAAVPVVAANATYKIKVISATFTAKGGDAAGITTFDLTGTQAAGVVKLAAVPVALLKKDVPVTMQSIGVILLTPLAKSFQACDLNTAINANKTGAALTGATSVEVKVSYALTL